MNDRVIPGPRRNRVPDDFIDQVITSQRGFYTYDHFDGEPPDGNKSAHSGWFEKKTGAATSSVASTLTAVGGYGNALLRLPEQAAPVAADAASIRLSWSLNELIGRDDLVGLLGASQRGRLTRLPQVGSDFYYFMGAVNEVPNLLEPTEGAYAWLDLNSPNWILRHRRAGALTELNTGVPADVGAYQTIAVTMDADSGLCQFWSASEGDELAPGVTIEPVNIQPADGLTHICTANNPGNILVATDMLIDKVSFGADWRRFR